MEERPHSHPIEFKRQYNSLEKGHWKVYYDDWYQIIHRGPFFDWRMRRAIRLLIQDHDRDAMKPKQLTRGEKLELMIHQLDLNPNEWGSENMLMKNRRAFSKAQKELGP